MDFALKETSEHWFMSIWGINCSLDKYLFYEKMSLEFEKLHEIAIGTARGIAYLHEDCKQRIIHYDIKPGNILLDKNSILKLLILDWQSFAIGKTLIGRGTLGYAAPEPWMPFPVTHKGDVYSFGMLLFEIIGRRRNLDINLSKSQEWFPVWVWKRFDAEELGELIISCMIEERYEEKSERMIKVDLSCVQYRAESRPIMSDVVKMLQGSVEISKSLNPFQHMMDGTFTGHSVHASWSTNANTSINSSSCAMVTELGIVYDTPVKRNDDIGIASPND